MRARPEPLPRGPPPCSGRRSPRPRPTPTEPASRPPAGESGRGTPQSRLGQQQRQIVRVVGHRCAVQVDGVPLAEPGGTGEGYTVTHSAEVLAFSPDDRAHAVSLDGTSVSDYAHDLPLLLAKT